tara:strand:- start:203 stop:625 length:423 start_codon:yes stop_codon:yes gene_type:complete
MNSFLILLIFVPLVEIYLFIKIGAQIGALNTIAVILITAFFGIFYARHEGINTIRSGISQIIKNETPIYEIVSGAAIAFAALLLILPGFATDTIGVLLIFPPSRKLLFKFISNKFQNKNNINKDNKYIDGESEDVDERKE